MSFICQKYQVLLAIDNSAQQRYRRPSSRAYYIYIVAYLGKERKKKHLGPVVQISKTLPMVFMVLSLRMSGLTVIRRSDYS